MKIVIQCAGRKRDDAGSLHLSNGNPLMFVARPENAPPDGKHSYARPEDISDDGRTWRERLLDYNRNNALTNPYGILPAYQLYYGEKKIYRRLVEKFGIANVFILSAGWGLIPADFLTPEYDITFTASAEYKRRRKNDKYDDLRLVPDDGKRMVFLGGKDYLPMFCTLTAELRGEKTIFYNSKFCPDSPSQFRLERYQTTTRTNWQYECANALIDGKIRV